MTVVDKENQNLKKAIDALLKSGVEIKVGVLSIPNSGDVSAKDKKKSSTTSVLEVAMVHEFGSPAKRIPKRSFLVSTFESKKDSWLRAFKTLLSNVTSDVDLNNALQQFGQLMQRDVRLKFTNNNWAPLKYRKGNPLLDTGQLRRSISYQVKKGKK